MAQTTVSGERIDANRPYYLLILFVSLVFMLLVVPIFEKSDFGRQLMHFGLTVVLISAAITARKRGLVFAVSLMIVAVAAPLNWSTEFFREYHNRPLIVTSLLLDGAFFLAMAILLLMSTIRRHLSSYHSIFGVVTSYLLLGLAWSMLYLALLQLDPETFEPSIFVVPEADRDVGELSTLIYYSFVTMSTLGYGDIRPLTGIARTLSWMQAVTGQFYIAVLVAWLIGQLPRGGRDRSGRHDAVREASRGA